MVFQDPLGALPLLLVAALLALGVLVLLGLRGAGRSRLVSELEASMGSPAWTASTPPPILMRVYAGRGEETVLHAAAEARILAGYGYVPVSQSVTPTTWQATEWLACVLLTFAFGLGILLFIYYAFVSPATSLLVAYERRSAPGTGTAPASLPR